MQLQREVDENRRSYQLVTKRFKEVELAKQIHNNNVAILDLASPRIGAFRTSAEVYRWTLQGFEGGLKIPPAR